MPAIPERPTSSSNNNIQSSRGSREHAEHMQLLGERFSAVQAAREGDTETLRRTLYKLPVRIMRLLVWFDEVA
jgi:hypothetical protein